MIVPIEMGKRGTQVGGACSTISTLHQDAEILDVSDTDHHLEKSVQSMRSTALSCSHQLDCRARTTFL
jgi:hypothetical protein